ncbi:hypothetical protein KKE78_03435 [Patescibacteria group bacterium]|nr:hypothetical protein [Patescibacteria group bacterium]
MNNNIKQFTGEGKQAVGEIAKEVKDSVGEALEQATQSVVGAQPSPQQIQQKQAEDQKQIAEARRKIRWYQDLATAQKAEINKQKQTQTQSQQAEAQEQHAKKIDNAQMQQAPKKPGMVIPEEVLRSQAERKAGKGLGG